MQSKSCAMFKKSTLLLLVFHLLFQLLAHRHLLFRLNTLLAHRHLLFRLNTLFAHRHLLFQLNTLFAHRHLHSIFGFKLAPCQGNQILRTPFLSPFKQTNRQLLNYKGFFSAARIVICYF